jgi:transposase
MLKPEEQMELVVLKKHGASIRGLSRSTGRSRNTVRRYLRGGDEAGVSLRRNGRRSSIRSRLTSSVG